MTVEDSDRESERRRLQATAATLEARFPSHPKRYLYILMGVGAVDAADRTILATVFEDVKQAFDVSDSQLGLRTGAYSIIATLSVIPFGWLADRWHRVRIIAIGFVPWSVAMIWTGAATSFAMMFIARLFLGTIEATNGPTTPSLLGDYYRVRERSRVMSVFAVGTLVGSILGLAAGGVLASLVGWRAAFFLWGGLGFLCGGLILRLLPEPTRGLPDAIHRVENKLAELDAERVEVDAPAERISTGCDYRTLTVRQATIEIFRVKTMWFVFVGGAIGEFFMSGLGIWAPTFFRRYHGLNAAGAGGLVALLALSTVAGIIVGGRASDRMMARGNPSNRIRMAAAANLLSFGSLAAAFGIGQFAVVIPFFLISGFLIGLPNAALQASALDTLVPHLRGRASAVRSVLRVGATALAPVTFGVLSDLYGLRAALLLTMPAVLAAGAVTMLAIKTYQGDMDFAQTEAIRQYELEERVHDGDTVDEVLDDVDEVLEDIDKELGPAADVER